jgi:hypothetical protein
LRPGPPHPLNRSGARSAPNSTIRLRVSAQGLWPAGRADRSACRRACRSAIAVSGRMRICPVGEPGRRPDVGGPVARGSMRLRPPQHPPPGASSRLRRVRTTWSATAPMARRVAEAKLRWTAGRRNKSPTRLGCADARALRRVPAGPSAPSSAGYPSVKSGQQCPRGTPPAHKMECSSRPPAAREPPVLRPRAPRQGRPPPAERRHTCAQRPRP